MPLYDYHCAACDSPFERRHRWDEPAGACPACGSTKVQRQLPTFAVSVKASRRAAPAAEACMPQGCARPGCPSASANERACLQPCSCLRSRASQARIDRITFQREHAEDALVHAVQRRPLDKALQRLDAERKLAQCQRTLRRQTALA